MYRYIYVQTLVRTYILKNIGWIFVFVFLFFLSFYLYPIFMCILIHTNKYTKIKTKTYSLSVTFDKIYLQENPWSKKNIHTHTHLHIYIYIYIYIYVCVCVCERLLLVQREKSKYFNKNRFERFQIWHLGYLFIYYSVYLRDTCFNNSRFESKLNRNHTHTHTHTHSLNTHAHSLHSMPLKIYVCTRESIHKCIYIYTYAHTPIHIHWGYIYTRAYW